MGGPTHRNKKNQIAAVPFAASLTASTNTLRSGTGGGGFVSAGRTVSAGMKLARMETVKITSAPYHIRNSFDGRRDRFVFSKLFAEIFYTTARGEACSLGHIAGGAIPVLVRN